jgi:hypothetical protein
LLGCFGDNLIRRFGKTPPAEWVGAIDMLNDAQLERGLKRLVFGGKGQAPSLPEFIRMCRALGNDEYDDGQPALPKLEAPDAWKGDVWDMAANRYLLGHIAKQMAKDPKMYGQPASYRAMKATDEDLNKLGLDKHNLDASGEFVDRVNALVAAKNAWAADMRDLAVNGSVPPSTQKAVWYDLIGTAEKR